MENHISTHKTKLFGYDFWQGFYAGFTMIAITGFGDKLFFLNMLYASINNFCDAFWTALAISEIMNLFNISLGHLLKKYTVNLAIIFPPLGSKNFYLFGGENN